MHQSFLSKLSFELGIDNMLEKKSEDESTCSKKTHIFWQGTNKFFLNGKIISGPNSEFIYPQIFLISTLIFSLIFYFIILPGLEKSIYHSYKIGFSLFLFLFMLFYILTAITEPGYLPHQNLLRVPSTLNAESENNQELIKIISDNQDFKFYKPENKIQNYPNTSQIQNSEPPSPKKQQPIEIENEIKEKKNNTSSPYKKQKDSISADIENQNKRPTLQIRFPNKKTPQSHSSIYINGKSYCNICKIYKLERTHHCYSCNACIRVHSHHCELTNSCIGKRNYKFFFLMIFFGFILSLYFICSWIMYYEQMIINGIFFYGFLLWIFMAHCIMLFCYCIFHVFLVFIFGQTAREFVEEEDFGNEYQEGFDWGFKSQSLVRFGQDVEYTKHCLLYSNE